MTIMPRRQGKTDDFKSYTTLYPIPWLYSFVLRKKYVSKFVHPLKTFAIKLF
jgi:hypothetical protein